MNIKPSDELEVVGRIRQPGMQNLMKGNLQIPLSPEKRTPAESHIDRKRTRKAINDSSGVEKSELGGIF